MKSIYIYWNYPKDNIIILWSLIDQFKATYKELHIHCYVNLDCLNLCNIINDKFLRFYSDKTQEKVLVSDVLDTSEIDTALLFHCSNGVIDLFDVNKVDSFIISNKLASNLDVFDNFLDPLEKIIKKVSHHFQLKPIKSDKSLSKLMFKDTKELELKQINPNKLVMLIDVSGINENAIVSTVIIEFIKEVVKDKQNYIVLIGATNYKNLQELELDNCINKINKVHFFQIVNFYKKIDIFVGKKGAVSDFLSLKNKMVIEIATNSTKPFLRNRLSSSYNTIANLKNIDSKNEIEFFSNKLISQFNKLVTNYNLNIKNKGSYYLDSCFLVDNPILFIFSTKNDYAKFIKFSDVNYLNCFIVEKWTLLNCFKISQEIHRSSIKIIVGEIPIVFEAIIRSLEWLKKYSQRFYIIQVPYVNQFSISEHISNASFNLKYKQL